MNFLKKYKYNYLLISAVILYCTYFIVSFGFFSFDEINQNPSRFDSNLGFLPLLFSALILAPVIEEILVRGFFTNNKILQITSIVGLPIFILMTKNYYLLIITVPYLLLLVITLFKDKFVNKNILFIYSAVIFALAHYKIEHFENIITIMPILGQFAFGLALVWTVINFNLKSAIATHFVINFLLLFPLFFSLQFPNKEVKMLENNNYQLTWEKTPVLTSGKTLSRPNSYEVSATNFTPLDVYMTYDSGNKPELRNSEMFNKYKISIKKLNEDAVKLDSITVKEILLKAELLIDD